jgi:hypothetical protein
MQAFFVNATAEEASFSVNYENNVYNSLRKENQKRSKSLETESDFNVLKIQITSETSNDRLYLLEHAATSVEFDNGYDAEKIFDNPNGPQIYATLPWGYTSINSDASFDGQVVGFRGSSDTELYTMTFDIDKLHSYDELYIYDTETELYVDIFEAEAYQFYGSTIPNDSRFIVTSTRQDASDSGDVTTGIEPNTKWNNLLQQNQPIAIYTTTGQLIALFEANTFNPTNNKTELPTGIYIVKSGDFVIKINIQ